MSSTQRESVLVGQMQAAIASRWPSAWFLKVHGGPNQRGGVPDLLVVIEGRLIALEAKALRPGETVEHARGRATLRQRLELQALQQAGATAAVVVSVEEALSVARTALE